MDGQPLSRAEYARRVLIAAVVVAGVAAAATVFVQAASVFLLAFAAVLLAILLRTAADALGRRTGLGPKWAFALLLIALTLAAAGALYLVGATAADQLSKLSEELPKSIDRVRAYLRGSTWGREVLRWLPTAQDAMTGEPGEAASQVARFFATSFGAAGDAIVLIFVTLYLAGSPRTYVDGLIRLVPSAGRPRAREVLGAVGERLRGWMLGQMVAMATVGVISVIGLKLIGVPQFLVLGLVAGVLTAVPYVGPLVGATIGVLAAMTQGASTALWALLVFTVAESLQDYVVTPLVQQQLSNLPPVLTLIAIALAGVLFGVVGLAVAAPLAVAIKTLVEELYIKDALGDREAEPT